MRNFLSLLLFLIFASCGDDNNISPLSLEGSWVNTKNKTDRLIFNSDLSPNMFRLERDKEMKNGQLIPKRGAGIYEFKIKGNQISVYNTISSCYCFNDYFFDHSPSSIVVGNFYDENAKENLQNFRKLN